MIHRSWQEHSNIIPRLRKELAAFRQEINSWQGHSNLVGWNQMVPVEHLIRRAEHEYMNIHPPN